MTKYAIGLDYGTLSVRGVLIDTRKGEVVASDTFAYPHGVITDYLPETTQKLGADWCLQHTDDYLTGLKTVVKSLVKQAVDVDIVVENIESIGVDFTCCTVLPVDKLGQPLLKKESYKDHPHAWVKLWKHHAAQKQANRINEVARERQEAWFPYYGEAISSEWLFPKLLQILEEDPELYHEMDRFIEAGDWLVWQLTGEERRSKSCAGYKAMYQEHLGGYPSTDYFKAVHSEFETVVADKLATEVYDLGTAAGFITSEFAQELGLSSKVVVAVNNIDAHVCVASTGVAQSNTMLNIIGTSSCDILLSRETDLIRGTAGLVKDGAVRGFHAYETGQNAVGDIFSWFVDTQVPEDYFVKARSKNMSIYQYLEELATPLAPGESGLVALDWWNGSRTPIMNADLTGLIVGLTLQTKPEEIYRALIEATAFGKRMIIENFEENGVAVDQLVFCGGLPHKNKLLNQIYADVLKKPIAISNELETGAKGAAIFSILATDPNLTLHQVAHEMQLDEYSETYKHNEKAATTYDKLYEIYQDLVKLFGENQNIMQKLKVAQKAVWSEQ